MNVSYGDTFHRHPAPATDKHYLITDFHNLPHYADGLGLTDALGETLRLADALGDGDSDTLALGETLRDAEALGETEGDGETDELGDAL
jgi:hypothetical protein